MPIGTHHITSTRINRAFQVRNRKAKTKEKKEFFKNKKLLIINDALNPSFKKKKTSLVKEEGLITEKNKAYIKELLILIGMGIMVLGLNFWIS